MTVNIKDKRENQDFPLRVCDIRDGCAYECEFGGFYIGNKYKDVAAFGIDGTTVITLNDDPRKIREVTLNVDVDF